MNYNNVLQLARQIYESMNLTSNFKNFTLLNSKVNFKNKRYRERHLLNMRHFQIRGVFILCLNPALHVVNS